MTWRLRLSRLHGALELNASDGEGISVLTLLKNILLLCIVHIRCGHIIQDHKRTKLKGAHDGTLYGRLRISPRSFIRHHAAQGLRQGGRQVGPGTDLDPKPNLFGSLIWI